MDIVIAFYPNEFNKAFNEKLIYHETQKQAAGYNHYHACSKIPGRRKYYIEVKIDNAIHAGIKIYFQEDNKIVGWTALVGIKPVTEEVIMKYRQFWELKDKILLLFDKYNWYETPIEYKRKLNPLHAKKININKVLRGNPEPRVMKTQDKVIISGEN